MSKRVEYYIVSAEALPDVFLKVAEAKRMLQTGESGKGTVYFYILQISFVFRRMDDGNSR